MPARFSITVDRSAAAPLSDQIADTLRAAILEGRIATGARLPSWRDLAAQLGVARGTVRAAYERLTDELLAVTAGPAGTRVADCLPDAAPVLSTETAPSIRGMARRYSAPPLPFQMGVPSQDAFPAKQWSRIRIRAAREDAMAPTSYPDPRGNPELRMQIASYLAIARGIRCMPDQVIVTGGYGSGLGLAIRTLNVEGHTAWMEEPGYPITRIGLELAGMRPVPVAVDDEGMEVNRGISLAPDAAMAVVTAGQQAPTGVALSTSRRQTLLRWATRSGGWIIEDDYLSELQLTGRAAPALAAMDREGRVIHLGTFSKTMSPSLGLGFLVAPPALAARFTEVAACLAPAPNPTTQLAIAGFMANGHYLRHLRRMKRLYTARRDALRACLGREAGVEAMAGLAVLLRLPPGSDDVLIAREALRQGLAPAPLSPWYASQRDMKPGLLLSVTNLIEERLDRVCHQLRAVIASHA
ncbi:PLP-dependent aminotransferase family protein [Stigmatella sp. ncwal1]|uniref:PLP-dependent aminotransferase family protein n=1 Tax=Stigmatella ashevillensis TaxID=2995309 RepID=A0ABT5D7C6_9BACT|nr:PLP-dependent aminotransferase family protein [Stigmatella ashevillena]MDC0709461.1 PLP-dependent aminotransferase family protein [Stigmatella ashevillena]